MPTPVLLALQTRLLNRFSALCAVRKVVFAIDHGLGDDGRAELEAALREATQLHHTVEEIAHDAPLVILAWAAEVGLSFVQEFWRPFTEPFGGGWTSEQALTRLFIWFADTFRGARPPAGAWVDHRRHIAWPLVNAVLPASLQGHLAEEVRLHWEALADSLRGTSTSATPLADRLHDLAPEEPAGASLGYGALRNERLVLEIGLRCQLDLDLPEHLCVGEELADRLRSCLAEHEARIEALHPEGGTDEARRRARSGAQRQVIEQSSAVAVVLEPFQRGGAIVAGLRFRGLDLLLGPEERRLLKILRVRLCGREADVDAYSALLAGGLRLESTPVSGRPFLEVFDRVAARAATAPLVERLNLVLRPLSFAVPPEVDASRLAAEGIVPADSCLRWSTNALGEGWNPLANCALPIWLGTAPGRAEPALRVWLLGQPTPRTRGVLLAAAGERAIVAVELLHGGRVQVSGLHPLGVRIPQDQLTTPTFANPGAPVCFDFGIVDPGDYQFHVRVNGVTPPAGRQFLRASRAEDAGSEAFVAYEEEDYPRLPLDAFEALAGSPDGPPLPGVVVHGPTGHTVEVRAAARPGGPLQTSVSVPASAAQLREAFGKVIRALPNGIAPLSSLKFSISTAGRTLWTHPLTRRHPARLVSSASGLTLVRDKPDVSVAWFCVRPEAPWTRTECDETAANPGLYWLTHGQKVIQVIAYQRDAWRRAELRDPAATPEECLRQARDLVSLARRCQGEDRGSVIELASACHAAAIARLLRSALWWRQVEIPALRDDLSEGDLSQAFGRLFGTAGMQRDARSLVDEIRERARANDPALEQALARVRATCGGRGFADALWTLARWAPSDAGTHEQVDAALATVEQSLAYSPQSVLIALAATRTWVLIRQAGL